MRLPLDIRMLTATEMLTTLILCPNGQTICAYVAATPEERLRGASGWRNIGQGAGLLLSFEQPGFYEITTRSMQFCLDILWLDASKKLIWWVHEEPQPQFGAYQGGGIYTPKAGRAASYVLELAAGEMWRLGLRLGDVLRF